MEYKLLKIKCSKCMNDFILIDSRIYEIKELNKIMKLINYHWLYAELGNSLECPICRNIMNLNKAEKINIKEVKKDDTTNKRFNKKIS